MIFCQLEVHIGMKSGILIYLVVVQNLLCVGALASLDIQFHNIRVVISVVQLITCISLLKIVLQGWGLLTPQLVRSSVHTT